MPKQIQLYKKGFLYSFREVSVRKKKLIGSLKNGSLLQDLLLWMVSLCSSNNYSLHNFMGENWDDVQKNIHSIKKNGRFVLLEYLLSDFFETFYCDVFDFCSLDKWKHSLSVFSVFNCILVCELLLTTSSDEKDYKNIHPPVKILNLHIAIWSTLSIYIPRTYTFRVPRVYYSHVQMKVT